MSEIENCSFKRKKNEEERVIKNVKEDYLICSICMDQYQDPRVLPCGHSFCLTCLADYIENSATATNIVCPIDRQSLEKPFGTKNSKRWAQHYPQATFLRTLVKAVEIHEGTLPICRRHHGRPREFYCATDDVLVCSECAVNEHRSENCDCSTLQDIFVRRKDDIQILRKTLEEQENRIKQLITEQYRLKESFIENKSYVRCELEQYRDRLNIFYETCLRSLEELSEEVDQAEFTTYNLESQLEVCDQEISGMKVELNSLKPGIDFMDSIQRIESKINKYDSEIEDMSTYLEECDSQDLTRVEFIPNPLFSEILDEYSIGSIINHSMN